MAGGVGGVTGASSFLHPTNATTATRLNASSSFFIRRYALMKFTGRTSRYSSAHFASDQFPGLFDEFQVRHQIAEAESRRTALLLA